MDRGAWQTTVHGVTKSWGRLSKLTLGTFPFFPLSGRPHMPGATKPVHRNCRACTCPGARAPQGEARAPPESSPLSPQLEEARAAH